MRSLVTWVLALALVIPFPAWATNWSAVAAKVDASIVMLEGIKANQGAVCTGFVINQQQHTVMAANHCWMDGLFTINGSNYEVLGYDVDLDLMVLKVPGIYQPALKLRTKPVVDGMEVMSVGHAYGSDTSYKRFGHVSAARTLAPDGFMHFMVVNFRNPLTMQTALSFDSIPGMSGGPVVDISGKVFSMTQMGDDRAAFGVTLEDLTKFVDKYVN